MSLTRHHVLTCRSCCCCCCCVVVVTADSRQVNVFTSLPSPSSAATVLNSQHISICPPHYTYRRVDFESCNRLTLARFHEGADFVFALWSVFVLKHERKCLSDKPNVSQCLLKYIYIYILYNYKYTFFYIVHSCIPVFVSLQIFDR